MKFTLSIKSALIAGTVATAAMTAFTFMAPLMGINMNIPKMLAGTMGAPIVVGWIAHFMIGLILAVNYSVILLKRKGVKSSWKTGAVFGLIPWFIAQIMVMPMMNILNGGNYLAGLFSGSVKLAMASLIGHLIYGAVLGSLYTSEVLQKNNAKGIK